MVLADSGIKVAWLHTPNHDPKEYFQKIDSVIYFFPETFKPPYYANLPKKNSKIRKNKAFSHVLKKVCGQFKIRAIGVSCHNPSEPVFIADGKVELGWGWPTKYFEIDGNGLRRITGNYCSLKSELKESAIRIQELIEELEKIRPNSTQNEKLAYVDQKTPKVFKQRLFDGIKAGGEVAVEEFVKNKYVKVILAFVKGYSSV